jgi:hypothetical protein
MGSPTRVCRDLPELVGHSGVAALFAPSARLANRDASLQILDDVPGAILWYLGRRREATRTEPGVGDRGHQDGGHMPCLAGKAPARGVGSSLEFPRRKAPHMDVKLVQARIIAVAGELNLEFQLILRDGQITNRAFGSNAGAAPRPVGPAARGLCRGGYLRPSRVLPCRRKLAGLAVTNSVDQARCRRVWRPMRRSN